ncbi:MAG: hypothetical protein IPL15_10400 [Comamonadaceae bacterium]|uniref:hypothetical protein n=1 Tax=Candidatus Skiveiella danica TaxID=3386177 RepID=UPI00390A22A3|nr:hypothetical protein [Comamonadaceae bacterium]
MDELIDRCAVAQVRLGGKGAYLVRRILHQAARGVDALGLDLACRGDRQVVIHILDGDCAVLGFLELEVGQETVEPHRIPD